ncbi:hypothetical protein V2G26_006664 [Clonostachys chloroleuca]
MYQHESIIIRNPTTLAEHRENGRLGTTQHPSITSQDASSNRGGCQGKRRAHPQYLTPLPQSTYNYLLGSQIRSTPPSVRDIGDWVSLLYLSIFVGILGQAPGLESDKSFYATTMSCHFGSLLRSFRLHNC